MTNSRQKIDSIRVDSVNALQPLGRYLILLFRAFEDELFTQLRKIGYDDLTPADLNLLRFIKPQGSQSVEIASLAGISKQAVSKALQSLEERKYIKRKSHPDDGRAQLFSFTSKGETFLSHSIEIIETIEARYREKLGAKSLAHLKSQLEVLLTLHQEHG